MRRLWYTPVRYVDKFWSDTELRHHLNYQVMFFCFVQRHIAVFLEGEREISRDLSMMCFPPFEVDARRRMASKMDRFAMSSNAPHSAPELLEELLVGDGILDGDGSKSKSIAQES